MPTTNLILVALGACWTTVSAFQATTIRAASRPAVQTNRKISMVQWDEAPADTAWAQVAWQQLGLTSAAMGPECYMIPDGMAPDGSRQVRLVVSNAVLDAPCEPPC